MLILLKLLRAPGVLAKLFVDRIYAPALLRVHATACGTGILCFGLPVVSRHPNAVLRFGHGVSLYSRPTSNVLQLARPCRVAACGYGTVLEIGNNVSMSGVTIVAYKRISIGDRTMIGAEAMIMDTDFHPLDPRQRAANPTAGAKSRPIEIGCDVFIGARAIILKGVRIGDGAVIGAAAVVTRDVAEGEIVAGNPARTIGSILEDKRKEVAP